MFIRSSTYNISPCVMYKDINELRAFIEKKIRRLQGLRKMSTDYDIFVKPQYIPLIIKKEIECIDNCSTCRMRSEPVSCPGCSLIALLR